MGLDTTHDCWHGGYSSFGRWRTALATAAGRPIGTDGFYALDENDYEWSNFYGLWQNEPADPLDLLLVHSDCEGYLFPHQLRPLHDRLGELLTLLPPDDPGLGHYGTRARTEQFMRGLRSAGDSAVDWYGQEVVRFR